MTDGSTPALTLLGSPHLQRGTMRFDLPDAMPGYLLAYLGARGDWVPREELAVLLWPEAAENESQNNLRVNLTRLRPHLARWDIEACFVAERRRLRLDVVTDVGGLRATHARGEWTATAAAVRGPFLAGMSFRAFPVLGEWAQAERDALRALWRDAVLRAGDAIAPQARLDLASRYLADDPFDEDVLRAQLGALAQLGRGADIERAFADFEKRVRAELGVGATAGLAQHVARLTSGSATDAAQPSRADDDDPLIGREAELRDIARHLDDQPLVSVIGLGGTGKTRIARAVQAERVAHFTGGVLWLSLIDVSAVAQIVRRIGDALRLSWSANADPLAQVAGHIGERKMLVVFDNAEHLLGERAALGALLDRLLQGCPHLRCLVTSREPLRHPREHVVRLEGLGVPAEAAGSAALGAPAVRLFAHQAQRHRPTFDPRGAIDEVAQIARLTAGLPLALRIAAAWTRFLSCADIAAEIRRGLDSLDPGEERTPGVRATLMRTWDRLTPAEMSALARLAVFASPFSAQAAREVAQAALPVLGGLVDRCLLAPAGSGDEDDRTRFDMHPLVRVFAAERLAADRTAQQGAHDRHASHIARLLAPWADFQRVDQKQARFFVGNRLAEILAAWHWSLGAGRPDFIARTARVLSAFFAQQGRWEEAIDLFAGAERQLDPERRPDLAALVEVGRARATMLHFAGRLAEAEAIARRTLAWARTIDHTLGIKACLNELGNVLLHLGRRREAIAPFEEALAIARDEGDLAVAALISSNLGRAHYYLGDFTAAERLYRESLASHRTSGQWSVAIVVLNNLASLLRLSRQYDEAIVLLEEGLRLCDEYGFASRRASLLVMLATTHNKAGRPGAAHALAERALVEARRAGERQAETVALLMLGELALDTSELRQAARCLHDALVIARTAGDVPNQLCALDHYATWCSKLRRERDATVARLVVLGHPALDAVAKLEFERAMQAARPDESTLAEAKEQAQRFDLLALAEVALAEWADHGGQQGGQVLPLAHMGARSKT